MNHQAKIAHEEVKRRLAIPKGWRIPHDREVIKQCACGAVYRVPQWERLPDKGFSQMPDDGSPPRFVYRDCPCGSTLAQETTIAGRPVVKTGPYLRALVELGCVAERMGDVRIPASGRYGGKPVSARALMTMRGSELEILFMLGIEEVE